MKEQLRPYLCGVEATLKLIGGKWKGLILWQLCHQTLRFSPLRRRLAGGTPKMLTQQLRELEQDGLSCREVFAEVPPRVEYSLTPVGRSLEPLLRKMCAWGQNFMGQTAVSTSRD